MIRSSSASLPTIACSTLPSDSSAPTSHCSPPATSANHRATARPVLWHQDGSYWPLSPCEVMLWISVSDSTPENGCMRMIPGSQTACRFSHWKRDATWDSVLGSSMDHLVDEASAVDLVLKPGDVSVHHPNTIHGSGANTSDHWRLTELVRYIPTTTRITQTPSALRIRAPAAVRSKGSIITSRFRSTLWENIGPFTDARTGYEQL